MPVAVEDLEIDRHAAEKRHIAIQLAEVDPDIEGQLVGADLQRLAEQIGDPAILIGLGLGQPRQPVAIPARKRDRQALGRLAALGVEDMGGDRRATGCDSLGFTYSFSYAEFRVSASLGRPEMLKRSAT